MIASVIAVNALVVSLGAGLLVGTVVTPPSNELSDDVAHAVVVSTPLRGTLPSADRRDTGPVTLPPVDAPKRIVLRVSSSGPANGGTYGVGVIPFVKFDQPVPISSRWKIEEHLTVSTSPELKTPVRWHWVDSQTIMVRPKKFWPAKTDVSIRSTWPTKKPLIRVIPSDWDKKKTPPTSKMRDVRMADSIDLQFRVGRSQILTIDASSHSGVVERGGDVVREVPVSLGKSGWETASGVKTLMEFYRVKRLQNTVGPETWDVEAPYSIRLTWSGEFLHSASWNPQIGSANTSHGCTNLTMSDAQWFYENGLRGDPVITKNTGVGAPETWDGDGAPWNIPWKTWSSNVYVAP